MKAKHRFLRVRDGVTRFADVTVNSFPAQEWEIVDAREPEARADAFRGALHRGLSAAIAAQARLGGPPQRLEVLALVDTVVDTTDDAVECAAAIAAWKSFGQAEHEIGLAYSKGRWLVTWDD